MNYTMIKNAALLSVATVGGVLSALMGGWDALLKALLICMARDWSRLWISKRGTATCLESEEKTR